MKIICIGRNYADHAAEMGAERPAEPIVFLKPDTALVQRNKPFFYPEFSQDIHHEIEVVIRITKNGRHVQPEFARDYISGIGLGIDFTARDLQARLKAKGQPWEIAKAFDHSAPVSEFFLPTDFPDTNAIDFRLTRNGTTVQQGNTREMLFAVEELIVYVSKFFALRKNDLLFTGTPAGVGPVQIDDELKGYLTTKEGEREVLLCRIK